MSLSSLLMNTGDKQMFSETANGSQKRWPEGKVRLRKKARRLDI